MANTEILEKILGNDLCAKWINLRDYAFDKLSANADIKAIMDTSDKKIVAGVPKLSSNTGANGEASADSVSSSSYDAWKVFDDDDTTFWMTGSSSAPHWIQYRFNDPVCVKRVYFKESSGYSSGTFNDWTYKIQGSNDGTNWTDLTETLTAVAQTAINSGITISLENNNNYLYYRYYGLVNNRENTSFQLCSLQFYIEQTDSKYGYGEWVCEGQVPVMTSATAPYGEVSVSSQWSASANTGWMAFDGNDSTYWVLATGATTGWISYKFINPTKVKLIKFNTSNQLNSVKFQASNDGTTWTDLTDTLSSLSNGWNSISIDNDEFYIYYRASVVMSIANQAVFKNLQFYAYQPKGNVPIMTSNTAPYGEASASTNNGGSMLPYNAFDGIIGVNSSNYWHSSTSISAPQWIQYKFVNPICVKKISFRFPTHVFGSVLKDWTYKIMASNDGTNFTELGEFSGVASSTYKVYEQEISNDSFYLYYRYVFTSLNYTGNDRCYIDQLQFYGREMKVSVPAMTSNTQPWGEAKINQTIYSNYQPYLSLDGDTTDVCFVASSASNAILYYDFKQPKKCNVFRFRFRDIDINNYKTYYELLPLHVQFVCSDDGENWIDIGQRFEITDNTYLTAAGVVVIDDTIDSHRYYGMKVEKRPGGSYYGVPNLQFFGFDYSERDWDTEHPMRYLYDHGVEVEEMDTAGIRNNAGYTNDGIMVDKYSDYMKSKVYDVATYKTKDIVNKNAIDLTSYNLLRGISDLKLDQSIDVSAVTGYGNCGYVLSQDATTDGFYLAVAQSALLVAVMALAYPTTRNMEITELWLE